MAVTITTDLVTLYTGDVSFGGSSTFSGFQRFGTACNGAQLSNTTSHFFDSVTPFDLTGKSIYSWMNGPGSIGTFEQGGYRIVIGDSNDNVRAYYVGGSDTPGFFVRGWFCFMLNGDNLPTLFQQISGGEPDISDITQVGVGFTTIAKATGNSPNCFYDVARVGTGITVAGDPNDPGSFSDIAAQDELTTNAWGIFRRIDTGVYGCQGRLTFGSESQSTEFVEENTTLFFENNTVSDNFYKLQTIGSSGETNIVKFGTKIGEGESAIGTNGVTVQSGIPFDIEFGDPDVEHQIYGSTIRGASNGIIFGNNPSNEIITTAFDRCGQVDTSSAFVRRSTFSETSSPDAALLWNDSIDIANSNFNGNLAAIEYPQSGTYSHDDLIFAGNTHDINFSGSGDLIINATGTSNTSTFIITGPGLSVTVDNPVTLSFTGLKPNTEVRIYDPETREELAGIENTSGTFSYQYNFSPEREIIYVIFNVEYQPIKLRLILPSVDTSLPIQQVFDRVFSSS